MRHDGQPVVATSPVQTSAPTRPPAAAPADESRTPAITPESFPEAADNRAPPSPLVATIPLRSRSATPETDAKKPTALSLVDLPSAKEDAADLGAAMRKAAGNGGEAGAVAPATTAQPGKPTLRPPAGALNAAIANAVREARACIAAGDPPVHASITFDADGVATARVPQFASAVPDAHACVTKALSRAHIAPFVEAPIAVPVTVRPVT
ncbi:MAG: hypothetical protein JWP87_4166 [Labilithrix sp.]|nr:hypothetical protein [Labilithrix sp.]